MSKDTPAGEANEPLSNYGMSREDPDVEETLLAEEYFFHASGTPTGWSGVEVVGVVGSIFVKEGLFGQSGWFSNYDLDWFWTRLTNIVKLEVLCDPRFRRGDACIWMSTQRGDYAMLLPHKVYADGSEDALCSLGTGTPTARFVQLPAKGPRPTWWPDRWKADWPFPEETRLECVSADEPENNGEPDEPTASRQVPRVRWRRLGPAGDKQCSAGYLSNISQLDAWHIERDTGMLPTRRVLSTTNKGKRSADQSFADKSSTQHRRGRPRKR
ncbi:hypothetical protein FRC10_000325 [Ceratobasidium sp. 414]|nr:hypothetical protein FRC10_000325 [Ceratobasidium sp. 414]